MAECASWLSKCNPAACTALANTVSPKIKPANVAVSKQVKAWNGDFIPVLLIAALMNNKSNQALCPTKTALWQRVFLTSHGWV